MEFEQHNRFQERIDELLVGGHAIEEDELLCEHLAGCAECQDYFAATNRAVAGLRGFSFDIDPTLPARVTASLQMRAEQLEPSLLHHRRVFTISAIALVLTLAGSFVDLQFDGLLASLLDIQKAQARDGLIEFWITPALFVFLLFPLLPLLSSAGRRQHERTSR